MTLFETRSYRSGTLMKKDYFAILHLKPDASDKEIRAAYKRLARRYHPDLNPGDKKAEEKFKEISEAHEVLINPQKRRKWEAGDIEDLFEGWRPSSRGGSGGGDPFGGGDQFQGADLGSLFGDLLGQMGGVRGGAHAARPSRGADLQTSATIGFEEALKGTSLRIPLARGGTRRVNEDIEVRIPAGVDDGAKIRVRGKGDEGSRGGPPGDLYVMLSVTPHPWFRREGRNVVLDLPLSLKEATLGARLDVPTIDGMVQLTVPAGSASGQRLRLKGRGAGSASGRPRGDQIMVLQIVTPKGIDDESRRLIDELERRNPSNPRAGLGWS